MRVTAIQYAKSLYSATENKSQKEIGEAVLNLAKILRKNRQIKLASEIYKNFGEIWNQEKGIVEAEIISREELHTELRNKISSYVKEKYSAREVVLKNIIDSKIKGGIIIKVRDEVLDGSLKKQLAVLKNILVNQ